MALLAPTGMPYLGVDDHDSIDRYQPLWKKNSRRKLLFFLDFYKVGDTMKKSMTLGAVALAVFTRVYYLNTMGVSVII